MTEEYTKETIVVHADMGAVVKLGEKVQLEGKLLVSEPQPNLPSFSQS